MMGNGVFNVAKGRVNELHNRVNDDDPDNAILVLVLLEDVESDAALEERGNLTAILDPDVNTECKADGYDRLVVTQSGLGNTIIDHGSNDRRRADLADQTFPTLGPGKDTLKLLICMDKNSNSGNDGDIIPLTFHDFETQLNGSDIVAQFASVGYFVAE